MEREKGSMMSSSTFGGARDAEEGVEFDEWGSFARKRNGASFPYRLKKLGHPSVEILPSNSSSEFSKGIQGTLESDGVKSVTEQPCENQEMRLWERLGKACMLDIEAENFEWWSLSSLYHIKHTTSNADQSEDECNKALEVTVNSGGVVFIALFDTSTNDNISKEGAAVIKIASSRMATQSERLGYEFARWLGVRTPQARVVHNSTCEWKLIKDAAENARMLAVAACDDVGQVACTQLLEALELNRCLFLMNYIHGLPLIEDPIPLNSRESAENTANALGKVLMLDLIIRNEDRLRCRHLGWRGNYANLLVSDAATSANMDLLDGSYTKRSKPDNKLTSNTLERRATSVNGRIISDEFEVSRTKLVNRESEGGKSKLHEFYVVAIDSGVPRRPPVGKRIKDQESYPKLVELIINDFEFSSNLLYDLSLGKFGLPGPEEHSDSATLPEPSNQFLSEADMVTVVNAFRAGFNGAVRDLEGFHIFLLTLSQKLDGLFRNFISIMNKGNGGESDRDESSDSPRNDMTEVNDGFTEGRSNFRRFSRSGSRDNFDILNSPMYRESGSGRGFKGNVEYTRCNSNLRLTIKIRDFNKYAKMDAELNKEMEQWYEMLRNDVVKLCQDNDFNTGFFECTESESASAVDAYELKVRLEHILERITLISEAASTERPSQVTDFLYIGGALAAKSMYTLQQIGITHVLCLCSNEIGQAEFQNSSLFSYKNFSVTDNDDENISVLFDEACDFIEDVRKNGGKILVHCFEGRSRSATIVLTYLMVYKKQTLLEAWTKLKKVHRRAHPNDGFGKILVSLDKRLYGKASMEWQRKKPMIRVCPICGKNAGLSSSSLKLHLQKLHKRICTRSVDSSIAVEIQKALSALKLNRGGSISPKNMHSQLPSLDEGF